MDHARARTLSSCLALVGLLPHAAAQGGTRLVKSLSGSSSLRELVDRHGTLYFTGKTSAVSNDFNLYRTDGTTAGTQIVTTSPPDVSLLTLVGDTIYFRGTNTQFGAELWKTDGTAAGTVLVRDILPGAVGSAPNWLTPFRDRLVFTASSGTPLVNSLMSTDGTAAGTQILGPTIHASAIGAATVAVVGDTLFFASGDNATGIELWKTDGTPSGTVLVKDLWPGSIASDPQYLTAFGGRLFFQANGGTGVELWASDGTDPGTVRVVPGTTVSSPRRLCPSGSWLFFQGTGVGGQELWKTDGTAGGTSLVKDIHPTGHGDPRCLTDLNGTLLFYASRPAEGLELWRSDGTDPGTTLVKDIFPGTSGSLNGLSPEGGMTQIGSRFLYFPADDGASGVFWRTDGTTAGTTRLGALPTVPVPQLLALAIGDAFFTGTIISPSVYSGVFAFDAGATAKSLGSGCGGGRRPTLRATDPLLGATMQLTGAQAYPGSFAIVLLGRPANAGLQLGSGCALYLDPALLVAVLTVPVNASTWSGQLPLPLDPALVEARVGLQALLAPTNGVLGFDLSDEAYLNLGNR